MHVESKLRKPLITGGKTLKDVSEDICKRVEEKPSLSWYAAMILSNITLVVGAYAVYRTLWDGIGMWGLNKTVMWAWDITNFVWWVGIGHAGTLISAILLLFRQRWRMAINRSAEAMTIFAVICAAMFPLLHMGRLWIGLIWVLPLPNTYGSLWVNFASPLLWDVFAITTYFSVSLVFWYIGLIPDFATIRDRAKKAGRKISAFIYGGLSFGWDGAAKTWSRYETVSLVLAGLATPLVLSVHTIVSMDFATSVIPGWHTTIFPPYFVAGAIFSGFAMVLTLLIITRKVYNLEDYITIKHLELMNIVIIVTGSIVGIAYLITIIAMFSVFIGLLNSLSARKYEIALMRVMGASRFKVLASILFEGLLLSILGFLLSLILSHIGMEIVASWMEYEYQYEFSGFVFLSQELNYLWIALSIGLISALYPAFRAYKTDIAKTLSKG